MKRSFCTDAVMHIYQRTIHGFNIFYSTEGFLVFYTIVSIYARRYGVCLMGLCQMIDHIHLLCMSKDLSIMSRFVSSYTSVFVKEFNSFIGRSGKLFEKAYGSAVKKDEKKVRSAIAYLFNNPVEKKLCNKAEDYRWNYLKYYDSEKRHETLKLSRQARRIIKVIEECYHNDRYLGYGLLTNLLLKSTPEEKNIIIDHIIRLYFPFDKAMLISHYRSYKDMVTAINSNTGSEYEIKEIHYNKTDLPYREMIAFFKKIGIHNVQSVICLPNKRKYEYLTHLKAATSASYTQIRKFLHIESSRKQV